MLKTLKSPIGLALIVVCASLLFVSPACDQIRVSRLYSHGVVASAAPLASRAGVEIMQNGGNAFDAAVAVGFTLAVVFPEAGNLGGGGFAVLHEAETGQIRALDFREVAPATAYETMYLDSAGNVIPAASTYGARAAGVPGTVAGLYELWRTYGSQPWADLVAPAIELARRGFIVDSNLARSIREYADQLARDSATAEQFLPGGRSPRPGDTFTQRDLARTLTNIAENGREGFYRGEVADQIVECMERHSGMISLEDLAAYEPIWRTPIAFPFDTFTVYSMPPPSSGGICVGQILRLLEPFDFTPWHPGSPEYIHRFTEAARLAFADRSEHLGDPDFWPIPSGLLDSAYLAIRRQLLDTIRAGSSETILPGLPEGTMESDQTTHFCVADSLGNLVSLTYTLNAGYGCKLAVDGAGFLLNNEMDDFSIKPGHANLYGLVGGQANRIEPGKRMLSSMSPSLVFADGRPYLILGTPGGSKIITVVAQAILGMTRFGLDADQCVARARFHHQWLPDVLYVEEGGFPETTLAALRDLGYEVRARERYGDLQMIAIDAAGRLQGASDPRGGGKVAGF